jgi:hypothetical protein
VCCEQQSIIIERSATAEKERSVQRERESHQRNAAAVRVAGESFSPLPRWGKILYNNTQTDDKHCATTLRF